MRIRAASTADAAAILEMARGLAESVGDPPPALDVERLLSEALGADRRCECLVAETEAGAVGYALVCRGFEAHTAQRRLWIADLYVRPGVRAAGMGRRLMQAVAQRALELGCGAVYWDLWRENQLGGAFYRWLRAEEVTDLVQYRLTGETLRALAAGGDG